VTKQITAYHKNSQLDIANKKQIRDKNNYQQIKTKKVSRRNILTGLISNRLQADVFQLEDALFVVLNIHNIQPQSVLHMQAHIMQVIHKTQIKHEIFLFSIPNLYIHW